MPEQLPQSDVVALNLQPSFVSKPKKRRLADIKEESSGSDNSEEEDDDDLNWRAKAV